MPVPQERIFEMNLLYLFLVGWASSPPLLAFRLVPQERIFEMNLLYLFLVGRCSEQRPNNFLPKILFFIRLPNEQNYC